MIRNGYSAVEEAVDGVTGRRKLMRNFSLGAAGMAALSASGLALSTKKADAQTVTYSMTDLDILNFALNLEYLEANYYLFAATGQGLPAAYTSGSGTLGTVTGGSAVPFQLPILAQYANNIAADEQAHVQFLRAALAGAGTGGTSAAVAQPQIDLQTSFTNLAIAAGLIVQGQTFNPFADEISFLLGAFIFEDVGVTAYGGALRYISNPDYIEAAGAIEVIEGYHAGTVRTLLASVGAGDAVQKISNLRAKLSGAADDEGILMPNGAVNLAPTDSNALAFRRTPQQVLNIVYFAQNASSGGFFPAGLNGALT
jgi:hypothetical protein